MPALAIYDGCALLPAGAAAGIIAELRSLGIEHISIQSSVPLQHVPWDVNAETDIPADIKLHLAFAVQARC